MYKSTHLGEVMETTCNQCKSRFRLTERQLKQAYGKVRCGECGCVFNALVGLKNYEGELPPGYLEQKYDEELEQELSVPAIEAPRQSETETPEDARPALSLHEAMYGSERRSLFSLGPLGWIIGILLLAAIGIAQALYYQRYQLIENPRYQRQVITLCSFLPCSETRFASVEQIRLLERNVFTHPVTAGALMVTGSFANQAPFVQRMPNMLISMFDVRGKLIANRLFEPTEYLLGDRNRATVGAGSTVQFRLEIIDPGSDALTYEFEFF